MKERKKEEEGGREREKEKQTQRERRGNVIKNPHIVVSGNLYVYSLQKYMIKRKEPWT